jgi:flagellar motility protein MotE (MotC chaperone)
MKTLNRIALALTVTLAINFVGLVVAGGLVAQKAQLDREKIEQVREVLFPPEVEVTQDQEEIEPDEPSPMQELMTMLDEQSGRPATERVAGMNHEFDARSTLLSRQRRELEDRLKLLDASATRLARERQTHEAEVARWQNTAAEAAARAQDEGFREALALYEAMPSAQAKRVLEGLDDTVTLAFLRAMDERAASKILEEFQTPQETERLRQLMEQMRQGEPEAQTAGAQLAPVN